MWDPLYAKWGSLPIKEHYSYIHIHWNSLSAVSHHLHLNTERHSWYIKRVTVTSVICGMCHNFECRIWLPNKLFQEFCRFAGKMLLSFFLLYTWKEWTGSCRAGFLTEVALVSVGSGGGGLGCTARLWLVTASCSAFNTFITTANVIIQFCCHE